jgi:hypothetical protein
MKSYQLVNGHQVNPPAAGENTWTVLQTGVKLTRKS